MNEEDIDRWLYRRCRGLGWGCLKLGHRGKWGQTGEPDRLIIVPPVPTYYFLELKTATGVVTGPQRAKHDELRAFGCHVYVVYGMAETRAWVALIEAKHCA